DVGIAEQHAVTLAAGIALSGFTVFCTIYSTFLQRAYDQLIHDVALQNIPVVFCIDRAGLVGEDGATHQGVFDISFLNLVPNMTILAPKDAIELRQTLFSLQNNSKHPVAVRYPRGLASIENWQVPFTPIDFTKIQLLKKGTKIAIFTIGVISENVLAALDFDEEEFAVYHFLQIKPLNEEVILDLLNDFETVITVEEGVINGGFGSKIAQIIVTHSLNKKVINLGIPDVFIEHATVAEQMEQCGLDVNSLQNLFKNLSNV
ncbi:MAG TPA: transketolase C-terminal domain-containing protein, partial [Flavobacterium sp.]|nr:transketolase C-terminal domain-containing protein [Flavobacterium sp.]